MTGVQTCALPIFAVLGELDERGIVPATVAIREPSLDDVFLALTGHRTEEATADQAEAASGGHDGSAPARGRRVPTGGRR